VRRSSFLEILHEQEQIGNRLNATFSHTPFGFENDFSFGFDINRIDFTHINNSPYTEDPANPSLVDPYAPTPGYFVNLVGTTPRYKTDTTQHSVFFEDRFKATGRLALVAGARYDSAELERRDLLNPAAGFDKNFYTASWRLGAVFDVSADLVVYGQYATGSDHLGSLITSSAAQANFDLSTGKQWEVGVKQALADGRGQWTLAYYDIVKEKLLTRDPDNPAIEQQVGERSARGVEAAIAFDLGGGWRIDANAAALRARFEDFTESVSGVPVSRDGNVPNGIPERTANLWLTYAFAEDWRANAGARYVGKRYSNTANTISVDSYTVFDAGLHWQTTANIATALRVFNLTDEVYTTGSSSTQWRLAQPRTVELSVDFRY
jgi:iron complex outermembrane receptor protein